MDTDLQAALGYAKGIKTLLTTLSRAEDILQAGLAVQGNIGDLQRARDQEAAKFQEAKSAVADTQRILDRAKQAVAEQQVKLENLTQSTAKAQETHAATEADVEKAVASGSARIAERIQAREAAMEADFQARAGALQKELDNLVAQRDTLKQEIDKLFKRLGG